MATETGEEDAGGADDAEEPSDTAVDDSELPPDGDPEEPLTGGPEGDGEAPLTGEPGSASDTGEESGADEEEEDEFTKFRRSVIVTTCATMLGLFAGIASMLFATSQVGTTVEPDNLLGFAILMGAVFVQFPLYKGIGIDTDEFDTKTQLYVFAMTFFMWFITWTVLLTTGALI